MYISKTGTSNFKRRRVLAAWEIKCLGSINTFQYSINYEQKEIFFPNFLDALSLRPMQTSDARLYNI
jgi:hypothetical protein